MSLQEIISSGFGLWTNENSETAADKKLGRAINFQRQSSRVRRTRQRQEDRDPRAEVSRAIAGNRDLEEMAVSLVEERNFLLKKLQKLQVENEDLRNENTYRHLLMQKMKKQSKEIFKTNERVAHVLNEADVFGLDGLDKMCLPPRTI